MASKSISNLTTNIALDATHFLKVSDTPVVIFDIEGEVNSTTGTAYYIQLVTSATPTGTVPLYSRLCVLAGSSTGKNGFSFTYRPQGLSTAKMFTDATKDGANTLPVYVAISSTDSTCNPVSAPTFVTVNYEDDNVDNQNEVISGDLTTGVDLLAVYTDPNASKRLVGVQASSTQGAVVTTDPLVAAVYLQLFAYVPTTGKIPLMEWPFYDTAVQSIDFGSGLAVQQLKTTVTNGFFSQGALATGCYLYGSSTAGKFTATTGTHWNIKAWNI